MMVRTMKRPVWQCTLEGEKIAQFPYVIAAAEATGIHASSIHAVLKERQKQVKGFTWCYVEPCENKDDPRRTCKTCNEVKTMSSFWKEQKGKDGYCAHCKVCTVARKEELESTAHIRKQHELKKERCCTTCNEWKPFAGFHNDANGKFGLTTRCKVCIRKYNKEWTKMKNESDAGFRMLGNLRTRMGQEIRRIKTRGNDASKCDCSLNLLGEDIKTIKAHMEERFQEGMTWDNYGKWHVDHIRPCASFDLTIEENQRRCFHYTNLQPLWAIDNLRKAAKYVPDENE